MPKNFIIPICKWYRCVYAHFYVPSRCRCHLVKYSPVSGPGALFRSKGKKEDMSFVQNNIFLMISPARPFHTSLLEVVCSILHKRISFYWVTTHSFPSEDFFLVCQLCFIVLHSAGGHAFDLSRVRIFFPFKMQVNHFLHMDISCSRGHFSL